VVAANPNVDELLVAPRRHLLSDLALGWRLRAAAFDLAIDFHGGPRASLLTWLSGARVRLGYDVPGRGWMYTARVARPRGLRPRHAVENQWDLLAPLGIPPPGRRQNPVEMRVDSTTAAAAAARLAHGGVGTIQQLVIVHVSAGNPFRRWPQDAFAALTAALVSRHPGLHVAITSGPSAAEAEQQVVREARRQLDASDRERVVGLGDCSLLELRALFDHAALFIGGDSGPLHVAATSVVPIVGLYGPTLPVRSEPWRDPALVTEAAEVNGLACRPCDQRVCVPGDFRCLGLISVTEVLAAAERALDRSIPRPAAPRT
jgi:ADP-heptose:LPS heptosyltransferase